MNPEYIKEYAMTWKINRILKVSISTNCVYVCNWYVNEPYLLSIYLDTLMSELFFKIYFKLWVSCVCVCTCTCASVCVFLYVYAISEMCHWGRRVQQISRAWPSVIGSEN